MKQPRVFLFISLCAVVGGALCVGAAVLEETKSKGPLPPEATALPGDARYVMGIDLRRFTASPLYAKRTPGKEPPFALVLADIRKVTGIDVEGEVEQVVFAGGAPDGSNDVTLLRGRWDAAKVSGALTTAMGAGARPQRKKGMSLYELPMESGRPARAVLLLNDQALLFGPKAALAATLERPAGAAPAPVLAGLVKRVRPGAVLWVCGDGSVLAQADKVMPGAGGSFPLPDLKTLVLSAEVDPLLDATILGEATDATAAKGLADTLRGLLSLAAMQGARRPEMQELVSAITVAQEGPSLTVSVRLPYDLIDRLSRPPRPKPAAPPARPSAS